MKLAPDSISDDDHEKLALDLVVIKGNSPVIELILEAVLNTQEAELSYCILHHYYR